MKVFALPFCLFVSCLAVFSHCLLGTCSFLKGVDLEQRDAGGNLGGIQGRETVVEMYYVKEDSIAYKINK